MPNKKFLEASQTAEKIIPALCGLRWDVEDGRWEGVRIQFESLQRKHGEDWFAPILGAQAELTEVAEKRWPNCWLLSEQSFTNAHEVVVNFYQAFKIILSPGLIGELSKKEPPFWLPRLQAIRGDELVMHLQLERAKMLKTLPAEVELPDDGVPAEFREGGKLGGEVLTTTYLLDHKVDWAFRHKAIFTRAYNDGKLTRRILVGRAYAYLYAELVVLNHEVQKDT